MSRLPTVAASRNISACSLQAVSQVASRLAVASRAKIRRPRVLGPERCLRSARKASTSLRVDAVGTLSPRFVMSGIVDHSFVSCEVCEDLRDLRIEYARFRMLK